MNRVGEERDLSGERDWSKGKDNNYTEILLKVLMEAQWEEEKM